MSIYKENGGITGKSGTGRKEHSFGLLRVKDKRKGRKFSGPIRTAPTMVRAANLSVQPES